MGNSDLKELEICIYKEILNWKYLILKVKKAKERRKGIRICRAVFIHIQNSCTTGRETTRKWDSDSEET